jgi:restriction system protein
MAKQTSKSKKIAQKTIFAAFNILKKEGGSLRGKEIVDKIRETVEFDGNQFFISIQLTV